MSREVTDELVNDGDGASSNSNSKVLNTLITEYTCISKPNQPLNAAGDCRYLNSLWVFGNREIDEPESPPPTSSTDLMVHKDVIDTQMIKEKITYALKFLSFREPRVFIQFWSPVVVLKRCLLMTLDQPFGLGMVDEGLYLYRVESEKRVFVVDNDYKEKELGPPGRAYKQKKTEWSFDVHGLSTRQYVQDPATCYNINGYIDLPVFEPTTGSCVGVLELITSSNYVDYAFEIREISKALKEVNLKCPKVFEDPSFCVGDERRQHELDEIFKALKMSCDIQKLPLAQTWALSGNSSFVANSGNLEQSCSSFSKNCIGKVCISTAGLPFHVRDLSMWGFHEACRDRHLEKSQGVVGRSLSSHGLCFCGNVTELGEDEYPLIHIAAMNGITSCLAIYLKSVEVEREYVIELYLPQHSSMRVYVEDVLETVWQQFKIVTAVQLGSISMSSIQLIGGTPINWNFESPPDLENKENDIDVTCSKKQTEVAYVEHMENENVENDPSNSGTSQGVVPYVDKQIEDSDVNPGRRSKISNESSIKRKKTEGSISLEEIKKHYGKTLKEAVVSLNVSRSTLKRICRSHGIPRWPYSKGPNESEHVLKSGQTDVVIHESVGALTPVFEVPSETTNRTHEPGNLEFGEHSSTLTVHQRIENISASKVENVVIKAEYRDNLVKFPFCLSHGLGKLEELVGKRFQLGIGSFCLKYLDEEGDMILVVCDSDLMGLLGTLKRPNIKTVIKLLVELVVEHQLLTEPRVIGHPHKDVFPHATVCIKSKP